jgi:hypothetical protein
VHRPQAAEARPGRTEGEVGFDELPRHPVADRKPEHHPDHRQHDAGPGRVVVILGQPLVRRLRRQVITADQGDHQQAGGEDQQAVQPDRIAAPRYCQHQAQDSHDKADQDGELALVPGELGDHGAPATFGRPTARTIDPTRPCGYDDQSGDAVPTISPSRPLVPRR